ncbi:zinc finger protein 28 [Drosophila tropicalis]|uniref:zinc finger protein 28 n=1 Tax=Drosophila tropicalis TaxID=46794 RepID=UPI0035ABED90
MSSPRCPRCKCEANGQNRLVTDSCGHAKCRQCLLADVDDCLECKSAKESEVKEINASQPPRPITATTDNHIIATGQGYHCQRCKKDFRSRTQQYYHRFCGNEQLKKYSCQECKRLFATRSHLKYHANNHNSQSQYKCNICAKQFKQQIILNRHLLMHQQEQSQKKYICSDCPRQFKSQPSLRNHMVGHTAEGLPHKCDICSKHFLTKSNLKQHRLKHDQNSIRYHCKVCPKTFLRQSSLRLHEKRHSKRERHLCPNCCKSYQDADALGRHLKQEHQPSRERFSCRLCEISVSRRDNMQRHLRSIHPGATFETSVDILNQSRLVPKEDKEKPPRHNSVIKSVGNVVALNQPHPPPPPPSPPLHQSPPTLPEQVHKENVKLYRKIILDLDTEELSTDEQPVNTGPINFSEMHWRKSFKFKSSYESEQTN